MCRIWGFSLGPEGEEVSPDQIARVLFPALTKGGPHAYGWLTTRGVPGTVRVTKFAGRADTKAALRNMVPTKIDPEAKVMIAHTRYATHGSPLNMNNNHPVRHGTVAGVHNGVIRNYADIIATTGRQGLGRNGDKPIFSELDSEAIFAAVNRWGHAKGLRKLKGDMVAVYLDIRRPSIVTIARSEGRPCHIGWTERGSIFWASEKSALVRLERLGIKFKQFSGVQENRILTVKDGKIVRRHTYRKPVKNRWNMTDAEWREYLDRKYPLTGRQVTPQGFERFKTTHPLRDFPSERRQRAGEVIYGPEWEGTAMAGLRRPAAHVEHVNEHNYGPALAQYLAAIEGDNVSHALRVAAAAETALVEKHTPIGDEGNIEERYWYGGQWLTPEEFVDAVSDAEGW